MLPSFSLCLCVGLSNYLPAPSSSRGEHIVWLVCQLSVIPLSRMTHHNGHVAQVRIMGITSWALFEILWKGSYLFAEVERRKVKSRTVSRLSYLETDFEQSYVFKKFTGQYPKAQWRKGSVFICSGSYNNKVINWVAYKQQKVLCLSSGGWEIYDWVAYRFGLWLESTSWCRDSIFLLCSQKAEGTRKLSLASFTRALIPFMRVPPSWANQLPKTLPPNPMTLRIRISTYRFGVGHKHLDHNKK